MAELTEIKIDKNNSLDEIWDKIKSCRKVAMTLHYGPDGDSFGSCTALKYVLERDIGIKVELVSYDNLSENMATIPFSKEVIFGTDISELDLEEFDAVLLIDGGNLGFFSSRLREKFTVSVKTFVINIDHHAVNTYFGTLNYVDPRNPSLCSLLIDIFKAKGINFDKELSERLLVGVCTDSGFFTYDSNPEKALADASFLISHGADYLNTILRPILYNQPLRLKKYFGILFNNLKVNEQKRFAYTSISSDDIDKLGLNGAEIRLGPNELQFIKEFDFIFTLAELKDHIKGSFRSKKGIDVSLFAKELGGGGHKPAASFILPKMSLEEAENIVIAAINKIGIHNY